jgi:hypothetical protein
MSGQKPLTFEDELRNTAKARYEASKARNHVKESGPLPTTGKGGEEKEHGFQARASAQSTLGKAVGRDGSTLPQM